MRVTIENHVNVAQVMKDVTDNPAFWKYAAAEWWRLYYDWVPMQSNALASNVTFYGFDNHGTITHNMIYAGYQYYGARKDGTHVINRYSTDRHPLASSRWDDAAAPTQLEKLERTLAEYANQRTVTG